jgi:hypothetical protein
VLFLPDRGCRFRTHRSHLEERFYESVESEEMYR